jgi:hypothetical protein
LRFKIAPRIRAPRARSTTAIAMGVCQLSIMVDSSEAERVAGLVDNETHQPSRTAQINLLK